MCRMLACALIALGLLANASRADDDAKKKKKKVVATTGTVLKVDADKGTLTVSVALKKKQFEEKEFKVTDKTTVTEVKGDEKAELKANSVADLLKKEPFKTGTTIELKTGPDGSTVTSLTVGGEAPAKKKKKDK